VSTARQSLSSGGAESMPVRQRRRKRSSLVLCGIYVAKIIQLCGEKHGESLTMSHMQIYELVTNNMVFLAFVDDAWWVYE
jgi:hypothetical protein